ncbi:MAG: DUF2148 domain-containing protein [Bacteroidales bacterium]|nr:DUF2148 domain-containing protein [Bacteroidales bacterium]
MIAAQTAPKGRGTDMLHIQTVSEKEKIALISEMKKIGGQSEDTAFFLRDAENIAASDAVILIGTKADARGLNCGLCGFDICGDKPTEQTCVFNTIDLGIALGSAVCSAAAFKVDNRIMYSAGKAAEQLQLLGKDIHCIFAIPCSVSSKSIFFDRK